MIDKTDEFWASATADDIDEYLKAYSDNSALDVKPVLCGCGGDTFTVRYDEDESAVGVKCESCGAEKLLADSAEYWDDAEPEDLECPMCRSRLYNVRVGFRRRRSGSVKWVYIGVRCTQCKALGSPLDWKIDYEPTDEMEKNI